MWLVWDSRVKLPGNLAVWVFQMGIGRIPGTVKRGVVYEPKKK
jgi:hypothetical protein